MCAVMLQSTALRVVTVLAALLALSLLCRPASAQLSSFLTDDTPVLGSLAANATAYYAFAATAVSYQQTTLVSVAASTGSPSLYVSLSNPTPSASSFDYAASWQTGGVVSISSSTQPPYTAYVAVQVSLYSRCNYTLLVTVYDTAAKQSTPIPLSTGRALASAIAAGEYRYFAYTVTKSSAAATIALTEAYGQSWLLLNSPNTTQLPTVGSAEYASSDATFPLVALQQPAVGVWLVGVWSNASSAFTIIAAGSTDVQAVELGVTYPGYVRQNEYSYHSVYLDPLLLSANVNSSASLTIALYSLDRDADLYCAEDWDRPTWGHWQWASTNYAPLDRIDIPTAELNNNTVYCAAYGNAASRYTFTATYDSTIQLTPGGALTVQSAARSSQLYSLLFPVDTAYVTLSVVVDAGSVDLSIGSYGFPPTTGGSSIAKLSTDTMAVQQLNQGQLCGYGVVSGSSPPLCEMLVLVTTDGLSEYRIVAYTHDEVASMSAGEQLEGVVGADSSALLSFTLVDLFSNVTLAITATNGGGGMVLTVSNADSWGPTWQVVQPPTSDTVFFQLDFTDPRIPGFWFTTDRWQGPYITSLTSSSITAVAFSAVYTVTDTSVYGYTIVELLDGVPQFGVVDPLDYAFYSFLPPTTGWPFATTVTVTWSSGYGILRAASWTAPRVGPLDGEVTEYAEGSPIVLLQYDPLACNPAAKDCVVVISVQGVQGGTEQMEYEITATTSLAVRTLYVNSQFSQASSEMLVGGADYWRASVSTSATAVKPSLLLSLQADSGSITVSASNSSVASNSDNAQQVWANITSAAVLVYPLPQQDGTLQVYFTINCTSADSTPCQYSSLLAQQYRDTTDQLRFSAPRSGAPVDVLLPPDSILWVGSAPPEIWQRPPPTPYFIMEAAAVVGMPQLYASCVKFDNTDYNYPALPNETSSTWNATTAPLAIDVFDFNLTATDCDILAIGVRASGGQAAWAAVSVAVAGTAQTLERGEHAGLSSPAFPVTYYQFVVDSTPPPFAVLSFAVSIAPYASPACSIEHLHVTVSDTNPQPDYASPTSYDVTRAGITLAYGGEDLTVAISNLSQPAGSLHTGLYYVAVQSTNVATCQYAIIADVYEQVVPSRGAFVFYEWQVYSGSTRGTTQFLTVEMQYNASTTLAIALYEQSGVVALYVSLNSMPSLTLPSSPLLSTVYNTAGGTSLWETDVQSPLYIPASACASPSAVGQPCSIVIAANWKKVGYQGQSLGVWPMTSAGATQLRAKQDVTVSDSASFTKLFQLDLPASPLLVSLVIEHTSPLTVWCSYRYVTPASALHDWAFAVNGSDSSTEQLTVSLLNITWANTTTATPAPLLVNADTTAAAAATSCYCTGQASDNNTYTISYTSTPFGPSKSPTSSSSSSSSSSSAPSSTQTPFASSTASRSFTSLYPSSSSSSSSFAIASPLSSRALSGGALAAAVVVPVAVLLLTGLLVWLLRSRGMGGVCCCAGSSDKGGGSGRNGFDSDVTGEQEVSMTELGADRAGPARGGRLMSQSVDSDRGLW